MSNSFATPWTVAFQARLSTGFPRQEKWSGLPFPSPGDFLNLGIKCAPPALASGFPCQREAIVFLNFFFKTFYSDFYVLICDLLFLQKIKNIKGRKVSENVTIILGVEFSLFLLLVFYGLFWFKICVFHCWNLIFFFKIFYLFHFYLILQFLLLHVVFWVCWFVPQLYPRCCVFYPLWNFLMFLFYNFFSVKNFLFCIANLFPVSLMCLLD